MGALNVKCKSILKNASPNKYAICLQLGTVPNSIHSEKPIYMSQCPGALHAESFIGVSKIFGFPRHPALIGETVANSNTLRPSIPPVGPNQKITSSMVQENK